tara:strand:+ start:2754 stop:3881 length:1128 start_codon:yes stop_codon:yes gene_type:complete
MVLLKSPLHQKYIEFNAKLINFSGWEMPISFSSLIEEHHAVRNRAGFFDISHMGVISVKGENPKYYLQKFFPTNIFSISEGQSCYSVMLNESGGIIDDLIIYDNGQQNNDLSEIFLIVNSSRFNKDYEWLKKNLEKEKIYLSNAKEGMALLALQGAQSFSIFEEWSEISVSHLQNFGCEYRKLEKFAESEKIFFAKTGYTGERGLEILISCDLALNLWDFLVSKKVPPCGLGARDTLRLEAGYPLYGNELNENINPYEAGLGWIVNLENNHDFFGRDTIRNYSSKKVKKKLIGIKILGKAIARKGCKIYSKNKLIGEITSGSWSPTLEEPIALAYIDCDHSKLNERVEVIIRDKVFQAIISKKNFIKNRINTIDT